MWYWAGEGGHRRRENASIKEKLPHRSAKSAFCVVIDWALIPERYTPTNPKHQTPPRALIGSAGEISELPQARSGEDTAEKFTLEDPLRHGKPTYEREAPRLEEPASSRQEKTHFVSARASFSSWRLRL